MTARDALVLVLALQRISPESLMPTAPVMANPELAGISVSRSTSAPFWTTKPTRKLGLYTARLPGEAGLIKTLGKVAWPTIWPASLIPVARAPKVAPATVPRSVQTPLLYRAAWEELLIPISPTIWPVRLMASALELIAPEGIPRSVILPFE